MKVAASTSALPPTATTEPQLHPEPEEEGEEEEEETPIWYKSRARTHSPPPVMTTNKAAHAKRTAPVPVPVPVPVASSPGLLTRGARLALSRLDGAPEVQEVEEEQEVEIAAAEDGPTISPPAENEDPSPTSQNEASIPAKAAPGRKKRAAGKQKVKAGAGGLASASARTAAVAGSVASGSGSGTSKVTAGKKGRKRSVEEMDEASGSAAASTSSTSRRRVTDVTPLKIATPSSTMSRSARNALLGRPSDAMRLWTYCGVMRWTDSCADETPLSGPEVIEESAKAARREAEAESEAGANNKEDESGPSSSSGAAKRGISRSARYRHLRERVLLWTLRTVGRMHRRMSGAVQEEEDGK
ncbi:hypothetical protein CF327_g6347 [Tilletia walkeri]|uniref:Uncharacterized protein n=1 Tax=Tilletia walkeri TaxID=117179 RepID=A0A8X7T421_9BASI|nr:hypothetical protein CF327_g6347 [Tilletia walkeri]KAE8266913.1 hypothetical protein A4X09_0g5434 [Tilletia walkeri]